MIICLSCFGSSLQKEISHADEKGSLDSLEVTKEDSLIIFNTERNLKIFVEYSKKSIYIKNDKDTIVIVPYNYDEEVLPVYGLVTSGDTTIHSYYIYKDKLLLLPVNDINNRMNLLIIDLQQKQYLKFANSDNYLIPTSINWYYFDIKNLIIVASNQINPDGKTMIHYYEISNDEIKLVDNKTVFLNEKICESYEGFRKAVMR